VCEKERERERKSACLRLCVYVSECPLNPFFRQADRETEILPPASRSLAVAATQCASANADLRS